MAEQEIKYTYSYNQEDYYGQFDDAYEAAQEAIEEDPDQDFVWVSEVEPRQAGDFFDPVEILEGMQERAGEECGECAYDWLDSLLANKEKVAELGNMIEAWINANEPVKFWSVKPNTEREFERAFYGQNEVQENSREH